MEPHELRRYLLAINEKVSQRLIKEARAAGVENPIAVVADLRDFHGRNIAVWHYCRQGMPPEHAEERVAKDLGTAPPNTAPSANIVINEQQAQQLLPLTSPTATQTLQQILSQRQPGQHLYICIAGGGNTYCLVSDSA